MTPCEGRKGTSGRPVQCCVQCDARAIPMPGQSTAHWMRPAATRAAEVWSCPNRVEAMSGVPPQSRDSGFGELSGE